MSICKLSVFKRKLDIEGVFWIIFGRLNFVLTCRFFLHNVNSQNKKKH